MLRLIALVSTYLTITSFTILVISSGGTIALATCGFGVDNLLAAFSTSFLPASISFFNLSLLLAFYNCNIIIVYVCLSIKFCLSISSQTDTNSFPTPVSPAALLAINISNLFTSAIGSHGKMMVGTEGVIPFPVYRSFSSQIGVSMCFHFQLCCLSV